MKTRGDVFIQKPFPIRANRQLEHMIANPCPVCQTPRSDLESVCEGCGWSPSAPCGEAKPPSEVDSPIAPYSPGPYITWIAVCLCLDVPLLLFSTDSVFQTIVGSTLLSGVLLAQYGVLNIWAVFGPGRFLVRWLLAFALAWSGSLLVLASGALRGMSVDWSRVLVEQSATLPIAMLAAQSLLWPVRLCFGWHLADPRLSSASSTQPFRIRSRQFRIRDIMQATALIAVAIGLFRLRLVDFANVDDTFGRAFIFRATMTSMFMFAGWSLLFLLPVVLAVGIPRSAATMLPWSIFVTYVIPCIVVVALLLNFGRVTGWDAYLISILLICTQATVLLGTHLFARWCGYRLVRQN